MNGDDKEHGRSEFYFPTKDFTFPVYKRNELLRPKGDRNENLHSTGFVKFKALSI